MSDQPGDTGPRQPWWADRAAGARAPDHRPPAARGAGARRPFGTTWWGRAWIIALESRAGLDHNRLPRGRGYARRGTVSDLTIRTGVVSAEVQGTRARPYRVELHVRPFTTAEWDRVLEAISSQLGHVAALVDGELPPEVVADVERAGLSLLPETGDILPSCSCPDVANPCKHAAAVCYLVADELDRDPFALLALRGRSRDAVLLALRELRSGPGGGAGSGLGSRSDGEPAPDPLAADVYGAWRALAAVPALPPTPLPPARPGRPTPLAAEPGPGSVVAAGLSALARDAAARAWAVLVHDADPGTDRPYDEDLARRAAAVTDPAVLPRMARAAGISSVALTGLAQAWRHAGADGLRVLTVRWAAPSLAMTDAVMALRTLGGPPDGVKVSGNRATFGRVQLRLGEDDERWYLCTKSFNRWDLVAPPADDPVVLLAQL